jgi:hypothetical protein|eukprot:COSAG02_NODE_2512_length_8621_cov_278.639062_7_plen_87_part_00
MHSDAFQRMIEPTQSARALTRMKSCGDSFMFNSRELCSGGRWSLFCVRHNSLYRPQSLVNIIRFRPSVAVTFVRCPLYAEDSVQKQ